VLDSPPGGNGNGRFDPGETGGLVVELRNAGNQPANNISAELRSTNPLFVITDPTASFGDIPACSTRSNTADPFGIAVDASMPLETQVPCSLLVTGDGYADTLRVTVIVGQIRQVDPIPDGPRQPALYWAYDDVDQFYPEHPEFSWVEVRGQGTMLSLSDDQSVQVDLPTGFNWQYYGQPNSQITICGNGWVAPGYTSQSDYTNVGLPTSAMPPMVAINWDDLYPPEGGGIWYYHDVANNRFVVEYDSIPYYGNRAVRDKFEFIIYDSTMHTPTGDNVMLVQYLTANGYNSNTVGIQDPTMTVAIQCLLEGSYHRGAAPLTGGRAIKYTTVTPSVGIVENPGSVRPASASVRAWPNPFRSTVSLNLQVTRPCPVVACVYDNNGRLVRSLEVTDRGMTTWDGRDETGKAVTPGIYFCRVAAQSRTTETKLVLTR